MRRLLLSLTALLALSSTAFARNTVFLVSGLGDGPAVYMQATASRIRAACHADVRVFNWLWRDAAAVREAAKRGRVTLVGYSMGGNAVVAVAREAGVPVRVVTLDPNAEVGAIPWTGRYAVNFYKPGFPGGGKPAGAKQVLVPGAVHMGFPDNPRVAPAVVRLSCH